MRRNCQAWTHRAVRCRREIPPNRKYCLEHNTPAKRKHTGFDARAPRSF